MPAAGERATSLLILGLLRRDDSWPTPQGALRSVIRYREPS